MPDKTPPPIRVYTSYIDGVLHSKALPHNGLSGERLTRDADLRFSEWLDHKAPGARAAGRVTGIRFTDIMEEVPFC